MTAANIYLPSKNGKLGLDLNQILYFEAFGDTDYMVLNNNKKVEILMDIDEIEQLLWYQGFYRVSKNYLVNLKAVQIIFPSDTSKIILENGKEIFVPQNRHDELFYVLEKVCQLQECV